MKKNKDKNKNKRKKKLSNHIWETNILLSIKTINMYKYQSNITGCTGTYMFINKLYTKFNVNVTIISYKYHELYPETKLILSLIIYIQLYIRKMFL